MRYLGGKSRISVPIVQFLESVRKPNQKYIEPFVGAAWVISLMSGVRVAYDKHPYLIAMWKALQEGWIPPKNLTKEQYYYIKEHGTDHEKGFVGFGCSFAGKWFGGFATEPKRNYCLNAHNSVMRKIKTLKDVSFGVLDYRSLYPSDCLIYCDPPYQGTTGYGLVGDFNTEEFWKIMRFWSKTNTVIISEYSAPDDFVCIWQQEVKTDMRNRDNKKEMRIEKLFCKK